MTDVKVANSQGVMLTGLRSLTASVLLCKPRCDMPHSDLSGKSSARTILPPT